MKPLVMLQRAFIHKTFGAFIALITPRGFMLLQVHLQTSLIIKLLLTNMTTVNFLRVHLQVMIEGILAHRLVTNPADFREPVDLEVAFVAFFLHGGWEAIVAVATVERVNGLQVRLLEFPEARVLFPARWTEALRTAHRANRVGDF